MLTLISIKAKRGVNTYQDNWAHPRAQASTSAVVKSYVTRRTTAMEKENES